MTQALIPLGQLLVTPAALKRLAGCDLSRLALCPGGHRPGVFSIREAGEEVAQLVAEPERSAVLMLLPDEYDWDEEKKETH